MAEDPEMKKTRMLRHAAHGPWGDASHHLERAELERRVAELEPPKDRGEVALLVSRSDDGARTLHDRVTLSIEHGMPGDAWFRDSPDAPEAQLAVMRIDFARLVANGQPAELSRLFEAPI